MPFPKNKLYSDEIHRKEFSWS